MCKPTGNDDIVPYMYQSCKPTGNCDIVNALNNDNKKEEINSNLL